ncbi:MAG TPA: hypothetical protein PKE27_22125 [Povalibacter sp.]|uniref:hypothetical protein n=1 Tax=Povalibacter sp. TaxID=1962978 RepID=UPI002BDBCCCD|nr:hypothetical protein [Povalibacter sp.]HMN47291.1 hypothetical protein [Povalibacter sp.]
MKKNYVDINLSKANFNDIYVQPDPRSYFSALGALDYMIPDLAEPVIRQILSSFVQARGQTPRVLDVGCSYGINAAVHRFPVNFHSLRGRYTRREMMALDTDELTRLDRNFYASWPEMGQARFIGLDVSEPAVNYAKQVGLLEDGVVANLETDRLTAPQAAVLGSANVILSTGAVGYVTERTYAQVLDAMDTSPWVISFVLRMFPFEQFIRAFAAHDMVTERLAGATFVQRRFRDADEFRNSLDRLAELGIDTAGFEADGLLHADLFLSRPVEEARAMPIDEVVTVASGRNRPVGARYVQVETGQGTLIALEP